MQSIVVWLTELQVRVHVSYEDHYIPQIKLEYFAYLYEMKIKNDMTTPWRGIDK